ncbi:MAG: hypothetical protein M1840_003245 [Geoglossum simile]|nr:MAG: hypothetical protein M1840_003245 [Geoglossum simile]
MATEGTGEPVVNFDSLKVLRDITGNKPEPDEEGLPTIEESVAMLTLTITPTTLMYEGRRCVTHIVDGQTMVPETLELQVFRPDCGIFLAQLHSLYYTPNTPIPGVPKQDMEELQRAVQNAMKDEVTGHLMHMRCDSDAHHILQAEALDKLGKLVRLPKEHPWFENFNKTYEVILIDNPEPNAETVAMYSTAEKIAVLTVIASNKDLDRAFYKKGISHHRIRSG